ncbi:unnamed protein product [Ceratitis capitata]|uniref:(Mediterranean fruit fly) hypothetical protein n=1 Tax=Ceratitis capitata TaxID=7213 RepID=A0A811UL79_CERCA|nr:unnamed protein product [Ceratitis capitata]
MSGERTFQHSRRPPDVEEALSSMLWTPYEPTSTESSSDEDDRCRINRLHKSHSSYDRRYAYEPLTTTGYEVENRFCSPAMMTVPTTTNVANSLQSTPFVPFTNYFYNNRNNTDSSDSPKISSNRKQRNSFKDGSLRFSYPYYGPIPSLNKWWAPSIGSKEPPSYDSLYLKESLKSKEVVAHTNDINSKSLNSDDFSTIKSAEFDERKTENYFNKPSPNESYSQPLGKLENIIRSTAASETCCDNAAHNRVDNNNDNTNQDHEVKENLLKNIRSQQTEECKNKMNKSNNNEQNDDDDDDEADSRRKKIQVKQHANNSQSNAMALSITAAITAETNNTTKEAERPKTTTLDGEEVSQPVSYIDSNENSLLSSDVRTRVVNNQKCKNNAFGRRLDTNSMNGVCSNNGMDAAGVSTLSNLFAELQSDKATSAKRACSRNWESNFTEIYAEPPVVDAVTIIQSVSRSFDGRLGACQSRSSLVALPSYSHLWEKTLNSVRSKVKRVTRSRFEIVPPSDALTPNKCLAELERLYAEFRASESALAAARKDADEDSRSIESRQHCFNRIQSDRGDSGSNCADECELLTANSSASVANPNSSLSMRLSVPAPTDGSFRSSAADLQTQQVQTSKVLPTSRTSSVFLGSPDYVAASCPPSNGRQRSISVSSDDRCSNLLHENKQNNGNCFNSEENEKIYIDDVVVGAIENAKGSNNNATEPVLASSATRHQASLTIHVNSDKSDQNNNSNCIYNKNNRSIYNLTNNCVNNSDNIAHIGVEAALQNVKVYVQQENIVKNNGVSVVNCNYSSAYQTNNAITITPVSSASVNRSGDSEVSVVPNNICKVKNITARSDSNGNEIEIGNFAENINVIGLNPPSTSALRGGPQQRANTSTTVSPTRSASTNELQSQANSVPRSATFPPVIVSDVSRTFTSTECQTDEIPAARLRSNRVPVSPVSNRVQRRRDRRERRQLQQQLSSSYPHPQHLHMPSVLRRPQDRHSMPPGPVSMSSIAALHLQSSIHHSATTPMQSAMSTLLRPMIPDLLHRHFPPPYSALPLNGCSTSVVTSSPPPTIVGPIPPPPPGTTLLTPVISTVPMPGVAPPVVSEGCFTLPLPIIRSNWVIALLQQIQSTLTSPHQPTSIVNLEAASRSHSNRLNRAMSSA